MLEFNLKYRNKVRSFNTTVRKQRTKINTLQSHLKELLEYVEHTNTCAVTLGTITKGFGYKCTCGLNKLKLKLLKEE